MKSLRKVPETVDEATVAAAEANLLQLATVLDPSDLAKAGRRIVFCLDPDGAAEMAREEAKMVGRRELFLTRDETGFWRISSQLDPERGAELHVAIQAPAKPKPSTTTGPDLRSAGQRNADALADFVGLALASDGLPSTGGHQPLVIIQIPLATLQGKRSTGPAEGPRPADVEGRSVAARPLALYVPILLVPTVLWFVTRDVGPRP